MSSGAMKKEKVGSVDITWGSDNIFADLKRPNPEDHLLKSELVSQLRAAIEQRGFKSQTAVAAALGIPQPHLSRLLRGHFDGFSVERILNLLIVIGKKIEIVVSDRPADRDIEPIQVMAV
jgi:predicted XRE-type DNA-binding protein